VSRPTHNCKPVAFSSTAQGLPPTGRPKRTRLGSASADGRTESPVRRGVTGGARGITPGAESDRRVASLRQGHQCGGRSPWSLSLNSSGDPSQPCRILLGLTCSLLARSRAAVALRFGHGGLRHPNRRGERLAPRRKLPSSNPQIFSERFQVCDPVPKNGVSSMNG
jgi:hypothetical protein